MTFEIRKISDVGTANPIVARLSVQTYDLIQWLKAKPSQHENIKHLYLSALQPRLIRCEKIKNELTTKILEWDMIIEAQKAGDSRIRPVPHIIDLQGIAEGFLYEAKNFVRDLLGLFRIVYDCKMKDASDFADLKGSGESNLVKWALKTFGEEHHFTKLLRTEQLWSAQFIRMRNAVEHPDGKSGTLTIQNIRLSADPSRYVPPTWQLTSKPESDIATDMGTGVHNMLTLAEDLLVTTILDRPIFEHIEFCEIPLDQRNAACPIRLQAQLSAKMMANFPKK